MAASTSIIRHVSRARARRLVATGRLLACTFAVAAAVIGAGTYGNSGAALAISSLWWLAAGLETWDARHHAYRPASPLTIVFDVVAVGALLVSTGGIAGPFFPMIVLPPFAAMMLYGKRAIFLSLAGGLTVYVTALFATHAAADPRLLIIRFGVLLLLGAAALRRADYEQRIAEDMQHLATWPQALPFEREAAVHELLARAAATLRTRRAAAIWSESDGASYFAQLNNETFDLEEDAPPPDLGGMTAFLLGARAPGLRVIDGRIEEWSGPSAFEERLAARSIIAARFVSQTVRGWLLLLDRHAATTDDLMLAEVVAQLVSSGLDRINIAAMMRAGAAAEERIRLSRDLHDGLLQSLSGLALHAQTARRSVSADPQGAQERLGVVVEQLAESQRLLRDFVDELRPELAERRESLSRRLLASARSIAAQWNTSIELHADAELDAIDGSLAKEVAAVVAEALSNAARHAGATRIRGRVRVDSSTVQVDVEDDGRGFPFHGRYELPQLVAEQRGPWSLKERVAALGGELIIESSQRGSLVEVRLPRAS